MTLVADTSAVVPALIDGGPAGDAARRALGEPDLIAPALMDVEVVHALRGRVRAGKLVVEQAEAALGALRLMPVERFGILPLIDRMWQLRENLTAYDAAYVALAELFDAVLVTADERLTKSPGPRCAFRLVGTT